MVPIKGNINSAKTVWNLKKPRRERANSSSIGWRRDDVEKVLTVKQCFFEVDKTRLACHRPDDMPSCVWVESTWDGQLPCERRGISEQVGSASNMGNYTRSTSPICRAVFQIVWALSNHPPQVVITRRNAPTQRTYHGSNGRAIIL